MEDKRKKNAESAKKFAEIRRVLCKNSNLEFAARLGISPQAASNICSGAKGFGHVTAEKVLRAFPEVSRSWLYGDGGPMLTAEGDNNTITQVGGNVGGNVTTSSVDDRLLAIIETDQRERLELLAIIRNLTQKP